MGINVCVWVSQTWFRCFKLPICFSSFGQLWSYTHTERQWQQQQQQHQWQWQGPLKCIVTLQNGSPHFGTSPLTCITRCLCRPVWVYSKGIWSSVAVAAPAANAGLWGRLKIGPRPIPKHHHRTALAPDTRCALGLSLRSTLHLFCSSSVMELHTVYKSQKCHNWSCSCNST